MNKQIFFGLLAVVMIAAVAALNVSLNSQKETLSDLAMENVEALASESGGSHCRRLCRSSPVFYCVLESPTAYIYCFERFPY